VEVEKCSILDKASIPNLQVYTFGSVY